MRPRRQAGASTRPFNFTVRHFAMARRILLIAVVVLLVLLVSPAGRMTLQTVRSPQRVTTVALLDRNEWTLNPFSVNGLFLSPTMARWLLLNTNIPYGRCQELGMECQVSLIAWAGRYLDHGTRETRDHALELVRHFIIRGEPVNQLSQGLTPLHEAVLYRNAQYLETLLHAGADAHIKADSKSESASGLTPLEFCLRLEEKRPGERAALCQMLERVQSDSSEAPNNRWSGP